ncbi:MULTISPECIES: tRNA dihydrouridine synthase DusB [Mycobacterium]|uniref:tRNA-dihydrouridine synthase n=1 Tax=Mycobacterium kiyosense TaxID=2871094 RepID=A0A9P3Q957_9MYCO|nr:MULTISPECIES: tRNA dihydrouridine synthase DusB [Mycobacterium]BDB45094.1 putative tRNA-dihydrouridine synthase [Mycobacterium kiyosense]BDE16571.1 putative tRNA-dihydrouridine synthase [Mycobacterium sp. 20KCMC460]GLB84535.1 putative tRNA-dihydrouridine synthase [Mycobacterium kiyosense]GLB92097.1 putative tRNA-dihydrouridine synthase [Mycobacterium kiyosense]GLB96533.1 putative tRNA-dihydrouridine synthase [Mycobacterium kiyosense]
MRIGPITLASPVVLAPMAGVTNVAFRTLCREQEQAKVGTVSGLYVCEMVTARALVERHPVTMHMTTFAPDESPRSLQLYTVDPDTTYAAAKMIADEGLADHIDMNFGCPVPKVTKRGGGAALPYKRRLFGQIVAAAVRATAGTDIPVTVKFRIGIDDEHHTHLDAGRIAEAEGAAAVALHARTAAQRYSGTADWDQIALLKQQVRTIPVLGNGDIYDASDALAMMAATGCDGVVIGRGCLGRPWLFAELSAAFTGSPAPVPPNLGEVADIIRRHGELLSQHFGEDKGMREIRKHVAWYLHGFPAGSELRRGLALVKTLAELDELLAKLDRDVAFPVAATGPRGRQGSPARVCLPEGWLDDPDDCRVPEGADVMHSGG